MALVPAPDRGVWRLGKANDPLRYERLSKEDNDHAASNRWSVVSYGILYCASALDGCFAEALAPFRVDPELRALIGDEWSDSRFLPPGRLPQDWRTRHTLVRLAPDKEAGFLDVEDPRTLRALSTDRELAPGLAAFGVGRLTPAHIHGQDRRVTRLISAWALTQRTPDQRRRIHGIAYRSRFGMRRCWAVFSDVELEELERRPIWPETPGFREVQQEYGLTVL
ncbi:RES domain-containing protein [Streptomyces sp. JJ36]|uniref:RES domain-containing protein n=1 Tax=Streptomyces sp. JJ36 TaxID=2736645 RepID=UPI001F278175|nr:RES domain-containing protein [Streptomyces sp. JJ36]